jgi:hypothetical protein
MALEQPYIVALEGPYTVVLERSYLVALEGPYIVALERSLWVESNPGPLAYEAAGSKCTYHAMGGGRAKRDSRTRGYDVISCVPV